MVASEVKMLATQTGTSTAEIGAQIAKCRLPPRRLSTRSAESADDRRGQLDLASIATAVEAQGVATAEIARNVQQTSQSVKDVTATIGGVSKAATETGVAATEVLSAADGLSRQAVQLTSEVGSFVEDVRAA